MLTARTRWISKEYDELDVQRLAKKLKRDPLIIALCYLRGLQTEEEIEAFLEPDQHGLYDPFLLKGMKEAVQRIQEAVKHSEKIWIYGDYDADGVTSTTILYYVLQQLGAKFDYYIPDRFQEGYGLNRQAIEQAVAAGVRLMITVDTGISAIEEVAYANSLGLDIIITDHHEPPDQIPSAYAVINPKQEGCTYPYAYLCGAGVALKLTQALLGEIPEQLFAYAAIGTIADLVPLLDENRLIAISGLQALRSTRHVGLRALFEESGIDITTVSEGQIGFGIGPRINAAGRLAHASLAVQLLTTTDQELAERLATQLNQLNQERQEIVKQIALAAEAQAEQLVAAGLDHVLVVAGEEWHEGVIGIVASRLVERFYRPAVVLSVNSGIGVAKGSARSIEGFDLYDNLTACKELLLKYGGHTMAAGLSVGTDMIDALRRDLNRLARERLSSEQLKPITSVEITCNVEDITLSLLEQVSRLAPFGVDNPEPRFVLRDLQVTSQRAVGGNGDHLKWVFQQGNNKIDAIGFRLGPIERYISQQVPIHVVAEVGINEWNGIRKPQLNVLDLSIDKVQIFDYRGSGKRIKLLEQMAGNEPVTVLYFRKENKIHLDPYCKDARYQVIQLTDVNEIHNMLSQRIADLVLYDLPTTYTELQLLRRIKQVERIWLLFGDELNQQGLAKLPDRETFKWFYAYFFTNKRVALDEKIWEIVKWKRLNEAEIRFMLQVFLELEFIYEQEQVYYLASSPQKRLFEESTTYQLEKERIAIETELLFSSATSISQWFLEEESEGRNIEGGSIR